MFRIRGSWKSVQRGRGFRCVWVFSVGMADDRRWQTSSVRPAEPYPQGGHLGRSDGWVVRAALGQHGVHSRGPVVGPSPLPSGQPCWQASWEDCRRVWLGRQNLDILLVWFNETLNNCEVHTWWLWGIKDSKCHDLSEMAYSGMP